VESVTSTLERVTSTRPDHYAFNRHAALTPSHHAVCDTTRAAPHLTDSTSTSRGLVKLVSIHQASKAEGVLITTMATE